MKDLLNNAALLGLLGTLFGGIGVKVVDSLLSRADKRRSSNAEMRAELRAEIESLRQQLAAAATEEQRLEAQIDRWQGMYYDLRDEKQRVVTELMIATERLRQAAPAEANEKREENDNASE